MTDISKKKEIKNHGVNPLVAGIAGVVAGGMAVAAAVAMSDKKNQEKMKEAWTDTKEKVTDYMDTIKQKSEPMIEKGKRAIEDGVTDTKKKIKQMA